MEDHYSDPLREGVGRIAQNGTQLLSVAMVAAQVAGEIHHRRKEQQQARVQEERARLKAQEQAERATAEAIWARAGDEAWLSKASLVDVGLVWGKAASWAANGDRAAERARIACEDRLRKLHPNAMSYYDRLRASGASPLEAMQGSARMFDYPARSHAPEYRNRPLDPGTGAEASLAPDVEALRREQEKAAGRRQAADAVTRLRNKPGGMKLGEEDLRIQLEAITNLPSSAIDEAVSAETQRVRSARAHRTMDAVTLAAADHPNDIQQVMANAQQSQTAPDHELAQQSAAATATSGQRAGRS